MVEHLPPGNPRDRVIHGPWGAKELMLWDISSRLRDMLSGYYTVHGNPEAPPVRLGYLPTPEPTEYEREEQERAMGGSEAERQDLLRVLSRPGGTR